MKAAIAFVAVMTLSVAAFADDKQSPDAEMAARTAAAEAKLKANSTAATQPSSSNDPTVLRAIISDQRQEIESLKARVGAQTQELAAGTNSAPPSGPRGVPAPRPENQKVVVMSEREFKSLPVFIKKIYSQYSLIGSWAADGTPMGFGEPTPGGVGYVSAAEVVRVIDESTAVIQIALYDPATDLPMPDLSRNLLIEGVDSTGQADNASWDLRRWFKVVGTRQYEGTTYFVAQQIVQADRTHRIVRKPTQPAPKDAPVRVPAASDSTTRPALALASIDGVWQEAPGVFLTVKQDHGTFNADCTYARAGAGVVHWEMKGTITPEGDINGTLRHTVAPATWKLVQTRVAKLSADGNTIAGTATWDGGADEFTWTRLRPAR